jgi:AmmeMemoRadiSam system protein B
VLGEVDPVVVLRALEQGKTVEGVRSPVSAVVPHHYPVAADLIGTLVRALRDSTPRTVVILGPDHQDRGPKRFTVSSSDWSGRDRIYRVSPDVLGSLLRLPDVAASDAVVAAEHSVLVPLPFLSRQFPSARFVLMTVRSGFDGLAMRRMAETLNRVLGPKDLVVASVDFSHYKTLAEADAEDAVSLAALAKRDPDALGRIPADSPMSLAIAQQFALLRGAQNQTVIDHQNSARLLGLRDLASTTSYLTVVFHR